MRYSVVRPTRVNTKEDLMRLRALFPVILAPATMLRAGPNVLAQEASPVSRGAIDPGGVR